MVTRLVTVLILLALAACGNNKEKALSLERKHTETGNAPDTGSRKLTRAEVFDCMINTLYYKLKLQSSEVDTIKTHYYHEIVDYEDNDIRTAGERLQRIREIMKDSAFIPGFNSVIYEEELDSLILLTNRFEKSVVGYILVHTFYNKPEADTQTMIFVLDNNCGHKDAIRVKSISDAHPEDYIKNFRSY